MPHETCAMPTLLKITFHAPNGASESAEQAAWERAHKIAVWPGLIWKIWIAEPTQLLFGGIYLFENEASAKAYLEGPIGKSIRAIPDISDFDAQLFEIEEKLSAVTRGPLSLGNP